MGVYDAAVASLLAAGLLGPLLFLALFLGGTDPSARRVGVGLLLAIAIGVTLLVCAATVRS